MNKMTQEEFWKKKVMISYLLAIFVFFIHISTYSNYTKGADFCSTLVNIFQQMNTRSTRVAVPLFFILSGAAFFRNFNLGMYFTKLKKRFHSLVIPFLSWNIISLIFAIVTTLYLSKYFVGRNPFEFTTSNYLRTIFLAKENIPFWFILTLIYFVILSPIFYVLLKNKIVGFIVIVATIVLFFFDIKIPPKVFHDSDSIIYFMTGAYIGMHCFDVLKIKNKALSVCGLLLFVICSVLLYFLDGKDMMKSHDTMQHIMWVSIILTDCFALYYAFDFVVDNVKFRPFMRHSFWVYAMHSNLSAIVTKLIFFATGNRIYLSFVNFILTIIITLAIIELVAIALKKYCKPLYTILSGDRP